MRDRELLTRTVYSFGSALSGQFGHLVLRPDGSIYGYQHPNEQSWELVGDELRLLAWDRRVTSRFTHAGEGLWTGRWEGQRRPLYLIPAISLPAAAVAAEANSAAAWPPLLLNTVPKSGTYFLEAALRDVGFASLRLHLAGENSVHDFRGLSDDQIHVDPWNQLLELPLNLVTRLLDRGELVVGHVTSLEVINTARVQGVCVVSVVRNLRDVIASYLRFHVQKVDATSAADKFWRTLDEKQQMAGFIARFGDNVLADMMQNAMLTCTDRDGILLRYEELICGVVSDEAQRKLSAFYPDGFVESLTTALSGQLNTPNPTFSGRRSRWADIWSDELEVYFDESGLKMVNAALGYEAARDARLGMVDVLPGRV
jgi:hypothetical protein